MLLSRSALVACGPRPAARGKKHDLFSTPAFASGQWRTRRGGRAPGGQQRAAERGASAPSRVRPPPEEGNQGCSPPHAVPAPRARSGPRPHPRAAPRPRPGRALHLPPAPVPVAERSCRRSQVLSGRRPAWPRSPQPLRPRELGRGRPPDLGACPAGLTASGAAEPRPLGPRAPRESLPSALTCPLRLRAAAVPHSGREPTVRLNQPPGGGGGGGGGGGRTGGAGPQPETARPPRPNPAPPALGPRPQAAAAAVHWPAPNTPRHGSAPPPTRPPARVLLNHWVSVTGAVPYSRILLVRSRPRWSCD